MKEVTYEDWLKNPTPRMMWVWDDKVENKVKRKVIYFNENKHAHYSIVALSEDSAISVGFRHCAEIEKQRNYTSGTSKGDRRMIKQYCVRTYETIYSGYSDNTCAKANCETLNSYLNEGWKVVMVTPKSNYNEYIIEKEVEDSEAEE